MLRRIASLVMLLVCILIVALPAAVAQAGESVTTTITYDDAETGERLPAENVAITVTAEDGSVIGTGVTDAEGVFTLEVPGPGTYTLTLDDTTLPQDVVLRDPDRNPATVIVEAGQTGRTIFATQTGEGASTGASGVERALQLSVEGIKLGLFLAMAAIGLSLIFSTTGLVNFAHSEMITFGMLVAYFFNFYGLAGLFGFMSGWPAPFGGGMNLALAAVLAVIMGGVLGYYLDALIFGPLRRRGTSLIAQLLVTIGLSIAVRYVFLYLFGGNNRFFKDFTAQTAITIGPIEITPKDLVTVTISLIVLVMVGVLLQRTRMGKAMRAVSDNRDLAESSGIDVQRVIRYVWVAGGALAALGGVFIGLAEQVSWLIGFRILLLIFAGVILGGLTSPYGALVGSLVVGLGIQLSTLFIPIELQNVGALAVLILVLLVRPQGILGRAERIG